MYGLSVMWYVYIIKKANDSLYTGMTSNIQRRLQEHRRTNLKHTTNGIAIKLLYKEPFFDKFQASRRERQIKKWTRIKKLALIKGDVDLLKKA